jgi:hypothetical protein
VEQCADLCRYILSPYSLIEEEIVVLEEEEQQLR